MRIGEVGGVDGLDILSKIGYSFAVADLGMLELAYPLSGDVALFRL